MKRDVRLFVEDIAESIQDIEFFSKGMSKTDLFKNKLKQNAIIRKLEIIGEAVKNLPQSFKEKYPNVAWKGIAGIRDVIIHAYFRVDLETVWKVINNDLSVLKKQIQKIKKDLEAKEF